VSKLARVADMFAEGCRCRNASRKQLANAIMRVIGPEGWGSS